jgi:hypothetical protein
MSTKNSKTTVQEQVEAQLADAATLTINEAALFSGLSPVYIRRAILDKKLSAVKEPIAEGSKTVRNVITMESFKAWRAEAGAHTKREDGRNKYVLYASTEEIADLMKKVAGTAYADTIKRANLSAVAKVEA